MNEPTKESVDAALALAEAEYGFSLWEAEKRIRPFRSHGTEAKDACAARILAAEVRRLRAELSAQPMIATETHILPKRK